MQKHTVRELVLGVSEVADDGVADVRQVQPQLVPSPGMRSQEEQRCFTPLVWWEFECAPCSDVGLRVRRLTASGDPLLELLLGGHDAVGDLLRRPLRMAKDERTVEFVCEPLAEEARDLSGGEVDLEMDVYLQPRVSDARRADARGKGGFSHADTHRHPSRPAFRS